MDSALVECAAADTYFGALMLSRDSRSLDLALSSLIQITKAKTLGPKLDGHGFVPGYSKGGAISAPFWRTFVLTDPLTDYGSFADWLRSNLGQGGG